MHRWAPSHGVSRLGKGRVWAEGGEEGIRSSECGGYGEDMELA